jgi:cytochrome P450
MRITAPSPGSLVPLDQVDLADVALYTDGDAHLAWQTLRAERPVFWQERPGGQGFWAVTRHADVRRILSEHQTFTSERGTAIAMLDAPDPAAGLMMQATDPPRHRQYRSRLGRPFSARAVHAHTQTIRSSVRQAMSPARDGGTWDAARAFSRLPMTVAAVLMALPEADVDLLLRLAFASLAPMDPAYNTGSGKAAAMFAHYDIIAYFRERIGERRKNVSDDLISHLLTIEIAGSRLTDEELLFNCLSLLLGAVVTTSQAISATLIEVAAQHGGEGRWPQDVPVESVAEEALRWSSPVTHFMRRARHDVEMHDTKIRAGDAVTAWIASANRDEAVFASPYTLDLGRSPNHHVAFGYGPHRCLGSNLARLMLREALAELIACVESFELAGTPRHLASNEIAGVVSLPLRLTFRN